jgi:hypothetical protein
MGCSVREWVRQGTGIGRALVLGLGVMLAFATHAEQPVPAGTAAKSESQAAIAGPAIELEPKALAILKAASDRLAAAKTMSFTALVGYESPSRLGPALVYMSRYDVTLQRPDKLRVISPGDGPASELYYDGKTMVAFAPAENMVAVASAPPTIGAALQAAYETASIYYPFADVIVADPYKDLADGLRVAFYIGQSKEVGGTTTDIVAYGNDDVFIQGWIGVRDKLPRRLRAVFRKDPSQLRHDMEFSHWQLDTAVAADAFLPPDAAKSALPIAFARPEATPMPGGATAPAQTGAAAK